MILSAQSIRARKLMIEPFEERTVMHGMTYGLGPCGYDIRIREDLVLFPSYFIGPKPGEPRASAFSLASSIERFSMPSDIMGMVADKSSWARRGICVQNTIIEPGWRGFLTLEISNHSNTSVPIAAGSPIAQIIFMRLDEATERPYEGKYQDQDAGPTPAKES